MRVLHVIEAMHQGGAESLVVEHVRRAGAGVTSVVAALNRGGPALDLARAAGATTAVLRGSGIPALERAGRIGRLAGLMRRERIEIVNGHNPTGALYASLAAQLAGGPAVFRTEHSLHYEGRHSAIYPWLERRMTRRAAGVICVCEAVRASHVARHPDLAGRFVTILNGIGPAPAARPRAEVRAALGVADAQPLLLTVGSLTPQKAQHALIEALAAIRRERPDVRLAIAGEGPLREALEQRVRELALAPAVLWLGARGDVADLMAAADLFVLSSQREGLSVTLLEAMRAGRPAVATAIGGNGEAIANGVTGRLVPPQDPGALARAVVELLSAPERLATLGCAALARWRERFTSERMVAETEALYRRVTADSQAVRRAR